MSVTTIKCINASVHFPAGKLPSLDPQSGTFYLILGNFLIRVHINSRAAKKLANHVGAVVLEGTVEGSW